MHGNAQDIVAAIMGLIQKNAAEGTGPIERMLRRVMASSIDRLLRVMSLHLISVLVTETGIIDICTLMVSRRNRGMDGTGIIIAKAVELGNLVDDVRHDERHGTAKKLTHYQKPTYVMWAKYA